jgi:hypothetical protein
MCNDDNVKNNLPARKSIRLKGYDYSGNGAYFITFCVKDKHEMLGEIVVGRAVFIAPHIQLSAYGIITEKHINRIIVKPL